MDSAQFCGQTCHTVMEPEYTAYVDSPHSRVACVECHIGAGAPWFVKAKISGVRQVFAVALQTYSTADSVARPAPAAGARHLRAVPLAAEVRRRQAPRADEVRRRRKEHARDERAPAEDRRPHRPRASSGSTAGTSRTASSASNTSRRTTAGRSSRSSPTSTTPARTSSTSRPTSKLSTEAARQRGERRKMDCMDCHNRPTHAFEMPERAVDEAMADGRISAELPFVKREAVAAAEGDVSRPRRGVPEDRRGARRLLPDQVPVGLPERPRGGRDGRRADHGRSTCATSSPR